MASQDIAHNPMHQIILPLRWKAINLDALCIAPTAIKSVQALDVSACANLNIHAEYVEPDKATAQVKKYTGLRDAYSQIGINFEHELSDNQKVSFHLFTPVDLANLEFQDTWDHDADAPQYEIYWTTPFIGIKTEVFDTENSGGYGGDGDRSTAAFVSYDYGKQTSRAMLADTDNYGGVSYTPGWDYHHSDTVKFFVAFYAEEETSAITAELACSEVFDTGASGGRAVAAGVSLNFAW